MPTLLSVRRKQTCPATTSFLLCSSTCLCRVCWRWVSNCRGSKTLSLTNSQICVYYKKEYGTTLLRIIKPALPRTCEEASCANAAAGSLNSCCVWHALATSGTSNALSATLARDRRLYVKVLHASLSQRLDLLSRPLEHLAVSSAARQTTRRPNPPNEQPSSEALKGSGLRTGGLCWQQRDTKGLQVLALYKLSAHALLYWQGMHIAESLRSAARIVAVASRPLALLPCCAVGTSTSTVCLLAGTQQLGEVV